MLSKYSKQQLQTAATALKSHAEPPFISHEWEELVYRLCHHHDPALREKMEREMKAILAKDPGFKTFKAS